MGWPLSGSARLFEPRLRVLFPDFGAVPMIVAGPGFEEALEGTEHGVSFHVLMQMNLWWRPVPSES